MTYFQRAPHRRGWNGYDAAPVWHIFTKSPSNPEEDWPLTARYYVAICGYRYDNIFMDARVSKAKKKRPQGQHCKRCIKKQEG